MVYDSIRPTLTMELASIVDGYTKILVFYYYTYTVIFIRSIIFIFIYLFSILSLYLSS